MSYNKSSISPARCKHSYKMSFLKDYQTAALGFGKEFERAFKKLFDPCKSYLISLFCP